ncbi:mandelate racemase/muconate lactonizing enzyme family protein [Pseudaquabacterium pictum]|uniref:Racemase n=1 Tax=Pseudaquabacterium pictum TaxID=2315236 RepID=A0A480AIY4_9BURK|nr:mandelate racemase/muconate lactonizing enzyme family protein [Rubrivivax pictus]GCL61561.1 racemase [Rubrivivax pictus]
MTRVVAYTSLCSLQRWGRPIGDVNSINRDGSRPVPVLLLHTDDGRTGVGLAPHEGIERVFPVVEGEDPRAVPALYDRMLARVFKTGHGGAVFSAIGAVDMALWDLKAQLAGEPLWRLLGGRTPFVPGYASALDYGLDDAALVALHECYLTHGFSAAKLKGGADPQADLHRLQLLQRVYARSGQPVKLMLDINEALSPKDALRHVAQIEQALPLHWVEEPVRRWDAPGHALVRAGVRANVASGENLSGLEQYQPLLAAGALDVVQTSMITGITHFLRLAAAAQLHGLPVSLVSYRGHLVAHAATAVPNHTLLEVKELDERPLGIDYDQRVADGGLHLGETPGLGVRVDRAAIEAHMRASAA